MGGSGGQGEMETKREMCRARSGGTPEAVPEGTGSLKWLGTGGVQ